MDANELFNKPKPDTKKLEPMAGVGNVSSQVNNLSRRIRTIEERYGTLRKKSQLTEQNMIQANKRLHSKIREAFDDLTELRSEVKKITEQIDTMTSELSECANRYDLSVVEKYVDLWQPMNFLTEDQAKRIIEDMKRN